MDHIRRILEQDRTLGPRSATGCEPKLSAQAWCGTKADAPRQIFAAIVYVLRTGCQWKALPREFGAASAIHTHFQRWQNEGFFVKLWQAGQSNR